MRFRTSEAIAFCYRTSVPTMLGRQIAFQQWRLVKYDCNNIQVVVESFQSELPQRVRSYAPNEILTNVSTAIVVEVHSRQS